MSVETEAAEAPQNGQSPRSLSVAAARNLTTATILVPDALGVLGNVELGQSLG